MELQSPDTSAGRGSGLALETMNVHPLEPGTELPLVVEPRRRRTVASLVDWLGDNHDWAQERLRRHGAFLFRGFRVDSPWDFERIARAIDPNLENEYLGTSPRDALTDYVFSASELPGYYPIPEHCEMSFLRSTPRHVFFNCMVAPERGGETPLVDFRAVWRELRPEVRDRFEQGGLRIVRNYAGPNEKRSFDLWQLKPWDEMFMTTDKDAIEAKCRAEGMEAQWLPGDRLRLVSTQPAMQRHPETGEPAWFNHVQVFHLSAGPGEYRRIWELRREPKMLAMWQLTKGLVALKKRFTQADNQTMHVTYQDGREIPDQDMEHLRDVIWKNMAIFPWRRGDVVAIDNRAVAHGRLPYTGPRKVAVAWA